MPLVPVGAAARAALGPFIAGGADGRSVEETVRDLDARSLAKALAKRCGQRVRRVLPAKLAHLTVEKAGAVSPLIPSEPGRRV